MLKFIILACAVVGAFGGSLRTQPRPRLTSGRIVGGWDTTIEEHPYQISLLYSGSHICGGSIINSQFVLTAAHCSQYALSGYSVRASSTIRNSGGIVYNVASILNHPQYDDSVIDYDFALIKIEGSFDFSESQAPIPLAAQVQSVDEDVAAGTEASVTGWGTRTFLGFAANTLQEVTVPIVEQKSCNRKLFLYGGVTDRMICAGLNEGGRDACQGDSGGPLVAEGRLVGVVSWGFGCAFPYFPGVYARVASARDWIDANSVV